MRTTIRLDDQLLAEVKQIATRTGRTITAVIEDALRESGSVWITTDRDYSRFPGLRWSHPF